MLKSDHTRPNTPLPNTRPKGRQKHHLSLPVGFGYCFELNLWVTLIFLLITVTMLKLGLWQLERRAYKIEYNTQVQAFLASQHQPLNFSDALKAFETIGRRASDVSVELSGHFLPEPIIFHDNRIHQGKAGLHILGLFRSQKLSANGAQEIVLINLGWISWPQQNRRQLPGIQLPTMPLTLRGRVFVPNPKTLTLETQPPPPHKGQWLLQKIDLKQISQVLDIPLAPFTLRLETDSEPTLETTALEPGVTPETPVRDFTLTTQWPMPSEKHLGYAVQWFVMALILTGLFLGLNIKKQTT